MGTTYRRHQRRAHGLPTWRIVRYADDFVVLVHGQRADVESLHEDVSRGAGTARPSAVTRPRPGCVHMADGFDFLGFRIQWKRKRGTNKWYVYTFIADRPFTVGEGEDPCPDPPGLAGRHGHRDHQDQPDPARLDQLLPARRLQSTPSTACDHFVNWRVIRWLRKRHRWRWRPVPPPVHHPERAVAADRGRRDRTVQPRIGDGHPLPIPRAEDPEPLPAREHHT